MRALVEFQRLFAGQECQLVGDPLAERVASAVAGLTTGDTGPADVAVLVRQVLLRGAPLGEAEIRVPLRHGWPDQNTWIRCGCQVELAGREHLRVRTRDWQPPWLDARANSAVLAAFREIPRKEDRCVPADPLVTKLTGFRTYTCPGQREAVRAAFLAPRGSTVLVNLPTGSGKTLAFQVPGLHGAHVGGVTLVIVPTVALARDQSERFSALLRSTTVTSFAYFSGQNASGKSELLKGISQGTQPIVFASPEAAFGALRGPLFEAASRGLLRCFAVDEAHTIAQWGQQFRPEFQALAGLRDSLLENCPPHSRFRTLLLTATLTQETLNTLRLVFGTTQFQLISEPLLRTEPGFAISAVTTEEERTARVLEALRHLPRPVLLYATEREAASRFFEQARDLGFARSRLVRGGDLGGEAGDEVLRAWRQRKVDLIVATSAFGLGVDQADVRSVVHACLPETMDRYYQELGRAGRDGSACISLLVSTSRDVITAQNIGKERLLTIDNAYDRWSAMWAGRRQLGSDLRVLSLDTLSPGVDQPSAQQASWNLRTLVLMARAGLLRFAAHAPVVATQDANESDDSFNARRTEDLQRFYREVVIRVVDARHSDRGHWASAVESARSELRAADERDLRPVRELRDLREPLNSVFRELYTLTDPVSEPPVLRGSCPVTRARGDDVYTLVPPELLTLASVEQPPNSALEAFAARYADEAGRCWVAFEARSDERHRIVWLDELRRVLRRLATCGVTEIAVSDRRLAESDWQHIAAYAPEGFIARANVLQADARHGIAMPLRRFSLVSESSQQAVEVAMTMIRPLHIIAIPTTTKDPLSPHRLLVATRRHAGWHDFVSELEA